MGDIVALALNIAQDAHFGAKDKAGIDYINHPLTVSTFVNTEEEKVVALLHDVLEDSDKYTETDLRNLFGDSIVDSLLILTHKKDEPYFDYIKKIKGSKNAVAIAVKRADLKHNSDIRRLKFLEKGEIKKNFKRLAKYIVCRIYLAI